MSEVPDKLKNEILRSIGFLQDELPKPAVDEFQYAIVGRNDGKPQTAKQWSEKMRSCRGDGRQYFAKQAIAALHSNPKATAYCEHLRGVILHSQFELPIALEIFRSLRDDSSTPRDCKEMADNSLVDCLLAMGDWVGAIEQADNKVIALERTLRIACWKLDVRRIDVLKYFFTNYPDLGAPEELVAEHLAQRHMAAGDYDQAVDVIERYDAQLKLTHLYSECLGRTGRTGKCGTPNFEPLVIETYVRKGLESAIAYAKQNENCPKDQHLLVARLYRSAGEFRNATTSYVQAIEAGQHVAREASELLMLDPAWTPVETPTSILRDAIYPIAAFLITQDRWDELQQLMDRYRPYGEARVIGLVDGAICVNNLDYDGLELCYRNCLAPDPDDDDHELSGQLPLCLLELAYRVEGIEKAQSVLRWMKEVDFPNLELCSAAEDISALHSSLSNNESRPVSDDEVVIVDYPSEREPFALFSAESISAESLAGEFANISGSERSPFQLERATSEVWCVQWQPNVFAYFSSVHHPQTSSDPWFEAESEKFLESNPYFMRIHIDRLPGRTLPTEFVAAETVQPIRQAVARLILHTQSKWDFSGVSNVAPVYTDALCWSARVLGGSVTASKCIWGIGESASFDKPWTTRRIQSRFNQHAESARRDASRQPLRGRVKLSTGVEVLSADLAYVEGPRRTARLTESSAVDSRLTEGRLVNCPESRIVEFEAS